MAQPPPPQGNPPMPGANPAQPNVQGVNENLPIVIPLNLPFLPTHIPLPTFEGCGSEDPHLHVRDFANICVSNQATDQGYFLLWFPATLKGDAADWYWAQLARTFNTWIELRDAFLEKFTPEVDQRGALVALSRVRQVPGESLMAYVRRFRAVVAIGVNRGLQEATLKDFFLEGLKEELLEKVMANRPQTLDQAIAIATEMETTREMIERIRMREAAIPAYLPLHSPGGQRPRNAGRYIYTGMPPSPTSLVAPLATIPPVHPVLPPPPMLLPSPYVGVGDQSAPGSNTLQRDELSMLRSELSGMYKKFDQMSEQMSCFLKERGKVAPPMNESGVNGTGMWCPGCRTRDHTGQNCPNPRVNQVQSEGVGQDPRGRGRERPRCRKCGKTGHVDDACWKGLKCSNCGGEHPGDRCNRGDKQIQRPYPTTSPQQIAANLVGQRMPFEDQWYASQPPPMPPSHGFFYPQNPSLLSRPPLPPQGPIAPYGQQNPHVGPTGQQFQQHPPGGYSQSPQDARTQSNVAGPSGTAPTHLMEVRSHQGVVNRVGNPSVKAFVTTRHQSTIQKPIPRADIPSRLNPVLEESAISDTRREEAREFDEGETQMGVDHEVEGDPRIIEDIVVPEAFVEKLARATILEKGKQKVGLGGHKLKAKEKPSSLLEEGAERYDLWEDLLASPANISIAQLLELAPTVKKALKKKLTRTRAAKVRKSVKQVNRVDGLKDPGAMVVEARISDRYIPFCLVDGGSGINVMPKFTAEKLGLKISPSSLSIGMADQHLVKSSGQIMGLKTMVRGEEFVLDFQILDNPEAKSYPLLLGRPWLHQARAVVNWANGSITYSPKNRKSAKVSRRMTTPSKKNIEMLPSVELEGEESSESESSSSESSSSSDGEEDELCIVEPSMETLRLVPKTMTPNPKGMVSLGPGLYGCESDSELLDWLASGEDSEVSCNVAIIGDGQHEVETYQEAELYVVDADQPALDGLAQLMEEEEVIVNHGTKTSQAPLEIPHTDNDRFVGVPRDWYKGPTERMGHAREGETTQVNIATLGEEPKMLKVGAQLSLEEREEYRQLFIEFRDIFAWSYEDLKGVPPNVAMHSISLVPGAIPRRQKERRMNPQLQLLVKAELEKLLKAGFIMPVTTTTWVSPMVLVKKKNGKLRVCVDYRILNASTIKDRFPVPFIHTILEEVAGHEMYSFMDGFSGYHQVSIHPEDWHKTAFTTPWGTFVYVRMAFGFCNAPATFQRVVTCAFANLLRKIMTAFMDDFSTRGPASTHLGDLRKTFEACRAMGLSLNPEKCIFAILYGILLGHVVSKQGIDTDPDLVQVILDMPRPHTITEVRRVAGLFNWYRPRMEGFAEMMMPITQLLKKGITIEWTPERERAFEELKNTLASAPCLMPPNWEIPFHIYVDASAVAMGAALCQPCEEGRDRPIAFASKQFTPAEKNYTTTEREGLAMVFAVKKYRHYLLLNQVVFFVDHMALRYLVNKADLSGRIARWILLLEEFDYKVVYKPGRLNVQADLLSRLYDTPDTVPVDDDLPDAMLFAIRVVPTWYEHIAEFLGTLVMPEGLDKQQRRKVRANCHHYALVGGTLYRRGVDGMLRRCVMPDEVRPILIASHDSLCGGHFAGRLTAQKALRSGYFWPTMFKDAHAYTAKCDACQRFSRNMQGMGMPLLPTFPLQPFERWGIDFIGEIHPNSSQGMRYLIVATEYLTKWAEAKAVKKADAKATAIFLFENIVTRYGCPKVIVSDQGSHFINDVIAEFMDIFSIKHRKSTPYHPQTNGQTERTNQTLVGILRRTVIDSKRDWDLKLPAALWAYRTSYKVTTRATPFSLMYGVEAILPIEYEVQSLRIAVDQRLDLPESVVHRLEWLEGMSEARRTSVQHIEAIQLRRKAKFDKKQKKRVFKVDEWVLLRDDRILDHPGKFDSLWMGPYVIKEVFPNGSMQLKTLADETFPNRVNGVRCKHYRV